MTNHTIKNPPSYLWWENTNTGVRTSAGVAFYDPKFGEYRLKPDSLFGDERQFYCRPMGSSDDRVEYRVEVVKKKDGKFWRRQKIGEGHSDPKTHGEIHLRIPPFDDPYKLIVTPVDVPEEVDAEAKVEAA